MTRPLVGQVLLAKILILRVKLSLRPLELLVAGSLPPQSLSESEHLWLNEQNPRQSLVIEGFLQLQNPLSQYGTTNRHSQCSLVLQVINVCPPI